MDMTDQGLQTVSLDCRISHYTTVGGPDILRNAIVLRYVTFYQINHDCKYLIFSLMTICLYGRMK